MIDWTQMVGRRVKCQGVFVAQADDSVESSVEPLIGKIRSVTLHQQVSFAGILLSWHTVTIETLYGVEFFEGDEHNFLELVD